MGVARQEEECREHAQQRGWQVLEPIYRDNDISARSRRARPHFERLLHDIASGRVDVVVAVHLDRVLRRVTDLERVVLALETSPVPVQVSL